MHCCWAILLCFTALEGTEWWLRPILYFLSFFSFLWWLEWHSFSSLDKSGTIHCLSFSVLYWFTSEVHANIVPSHRRYFFLSPLTLSSKCWDRNKLALLTHWGRWLLTSPRYNRMVLLWERGPKLWAEVSWERNPGCSQAFREVLSWSLLT